MGSVIPYLQCLNTAESIVWYQKAFGATESRARLVAPDGTCMNAEIEIEGARIMLADEMPSVGSSSLEKTDGTTVVLSLYVADVEAVFAEALKQGATEVFPVADQFHGDRSGRLRDPFGHHWIVATKIRDVSDEEMLEAFQGMFA